MYNALKLLSPTVYIISITQHPVSAQLGSKNTLVTSRPVGATLIGAPEVSSIHLYTLGVSSTVAGARGFANASNGPGGSTWPSRSRGTQVIGGPVMSVKTSMLRASAAACMVPKIPLMVTKNLASVESVYVTIDSNKRLNSASPSAIAVGSQVMERGAEVAVAPSAPKTSKEAYRSAKLVEKGGAEVGTSASEGYERTIRTVHAPVLQSSPSKP
mmetsp:Transcript_31227/g.64712  ORF Transcript_31227/g.64712 Transcript_31227/m.64712 type:complete len:214 (+) Transcript_31227:2016-2657(+)